jgi:putative spermidine/putrescine transport system permease protein
MRREPGWILNLVAGTVYLFLLTPMLVVVLYSFSEKSFFVFPPEGFSLRWYEAAWKSDKFLGPAARSIFVAVGSTLIATLFAVPAALGLRRIGGGRAARVIEFLLLAPMIVPALILGIALLYLYNRFGAVDTLGGMLAAHVVLVFPFVFRSVLVSVHGLRLHYEEASEMLGAPPWRTFWHVVLPGLMPGVIAGGILAFIVSFDQFTISLFVAQSDQVTLPVALYKYLYDVNDPVAAAVSTVLVAFGFVVALVTQRAGWLEHAGGRGG